MQPEAGVKANSLATKGNPLQSSWTASGKASNASASKNITSNVSSNFNGKVNNEFIQNSFIGSGSNLPVHAQDVKEHKSLSELRVPSHEIGAPNHQVLPEKIDFVVANGADGFVYVDETTGTGQRIELPRKYSLAKLSIKTKSRFMPLTFKATMKDSSTQLLVNGKEGLDVASEALSPYWLVIHRKGLLSYHKVSFTILRNIGGFHLSRDTPLSALLEDKRARKTLFTVCSAKACYVLCEIWL